MIALMGVPVIIAYDAKADSVLADRLKWIP